MDFVYEDFRCNEFLRNANSISDIAEEVYIYNKRRDRVISSSTTGSAEEYFEQKHKSRNFSIDEWREILNAPHRNELILLPKNDLRNSKSDASPNYIAYLRTLQNISEKDKELTLVILINTEKIISAISNSGLGSSDQFSVLDRKGTPMITIGNVVEPQELSTLNNGEYKFGKDRYSVNVIDSATTSWKYIMIGRQTAFINRQKQLNIVVYLCLFLFIVMSVLLTYIISKSNYRPVERLIDIMNIGRSNDYNEFSVIEKKISEMRSSYISLVKSNQKSFYKQRDEYFKSILEGSESADELFEPEVMEKYEFNVLSEVFAVVLVRIKNTSVFVDKLDMTLDMAQYAMHNVMLELIESEGQKGWTCTVAPDTMGVLINLDNGKSSSNDILLRITGKLCDFFMNYYSAQLLAAVGDEVNSIYEIENSYRRAQNAVSYGIVTDSKETVFSSELLNKRDDYVYTIDSEHRLTAALKSGDFSRSKEIMDELFSTNVASRTHSASAIQLFMLEMYRTLSNVLPNAPAINFVDFEKISAGEMYNRMLKSVAEHCNLINCRRQRSVGDRVKEYIEENYRDQNLSVGAIGEYFGLTPSYLSKLFREETDETILNYIHIVRIKHAEELLKEGMSVEKTAKTVGYTNVNSFARVYKKITGMTPKMSRTKM